MLPAVDTAPPVSVEPPASRRIARAVGSFPVVLGVLLAVLVLLTVRGRFSDPDMWWHLKTGEVIWKTHHIPVTDGFSFTASRHAYVPHEWLAQLSIYAAFHLGGYSGLMLWLWVIASLLVLGAYALCALYSGNIKIAFLGGLIAWLFATAAMAIRPQLLGYLLLVCLLITIHLGRTRHRNWFFTLPGLFALWVNIHGSFFLGLGVMGAALVCSCLDFRWGVLESSRWSRPERSAFALAASLSLAALFLNPAGIRQLTYPIEMMTRLRLNTSQIAEWRPAGASDPRGVALFLIAGLILLLPLVRRSRLRAVELVCLALGFSLAVEHMRMLIVFGIIAGPVLCRLLANCWSRYDPDRDQPAAAAVVIGAAVVAAVVGFPNRAQLLREVEQSNPVKAVEYIARSGLSGNMLNDYTWGGYLIWAAPRHKVFIDGRGDLFEWTGVLEEYLKWIALETDPSTLLDKYRIQFCLLPTDAPINQLLAQMPVWTKAYSDEAAVIWVRSATGPASQPAGANPLTASRERRLSSSR